MKTKIRVLSAITALGLLSGMEARPALDAGYYLANNINIASKTNIYKSNHYRMAQAGVITPDDTSASWDIFGNSSIGYRGMGVNVKDYPVDPDRPMELLAFVEYGFNNPAEQKDGKPNEALGLYVYFYNPSGKPLAFGTEITMALPEPGKDVTDPSSGGYENYRMDPQRDDWHTGGTSDNQYLFYKMKIANDDTFRIYEKVKNYISETDVNGNPNYNSVLRRYAVSNIFARIDEPETRSISYPIGRETAYSGYGQNMNGKGSPSTLSNKQSNILAIKIETTPYNSLLTHTEVEMDPGGWFAEATRNKYNGLAQNILFKLPGEVNKYGELKEVHYDYWKYRTQWIPITDKQERYEQIYNWVGKRRAGADVKWPGGRVGPEPNLTVIGSGGFDRPNVSFEWRTSARKKDWIKESSDDFIWALSQEIPIDTDDIGFDDHEENADQHNRAGGHHYYNMPLWTQVKVWDPQGSGALIPFGWNYYDDFMKQNNDWHLGNTYSDINGAIGWVIKVDSLAGGYVPSELLQQYIAQYQAPENRFRRPRRNGYISGDLVYIPTYNRDDYGYKEKRTDRKGLGVNRAEIFHQYLINAYGKSSGDNAFEMFKTEYKSQYDNLNEKVDALAPIEADDNYYIQNTYEPDKNKVNEFIKSKTDEEKLYNLNYDFSLSNSYGTLLRDYSWELPATDSKSVAMVKEDITLDFSFIDMTFTKDGKDYILPITNDPVDNIPAPELPGYDDHLSFWEILIIILISFVFGLWFFFFGGIRSIWNLLTRIVVGTINIAYWILVWWWLAIVFKATGRDLPKAIGVSVDPILWKRG